MASAGAKGLGGEDVITFSKDPSTDPGTYSGPTFVIFAIFSK
jgi:hypothetical protein